LDESRAIGKPLLRLNSSTIRRHLIGGGTTRSTRSGRRQLSAHAGGLSVYRA
jgi:hypothetical protein